MKNKQEIIDALAFRIREIELAYLNAQDVLAEALEYIRDSRDQYAEDEEQGREHDDKETQKNTEREVENECG